MNSLESLMIRDRLESAAPCRICSARPMLYSTRKYSDLLKQKEGKIIGWATVRCDVCGVQCGIDIDDTGSKTGVEAERVAIDRWDTIMLPYYGPMGTGIPGTYGQCPIFDAWCGECVGISTEYDGVCEDCPKFRTPRR